MFTSQMGPSKPFGVNSDSFFGAFICDYSLGYFFFFASKRQTICKTMSKYIQAPAFEACS